jgi:Fe-S-cluster containining protein
MKPSLTETLCTRCGLCCDGSLFADVELAGRAETSALEVLGLEIEDADDDRGGLLLQPCRALKAKRCRIYPHRPDCCRTFECRLLQEVKRGLVSLDRAKEKIAEALNRIQQVNNLILHLTQGHEHLPLKERCIEALTLSEEFEGDPETQRKRSELEMAMTSVENLIQKTFLGRPVTLQEADARGRGLR